MDTASVFNLPSKTSRRITFILKRGLDIVFSLLALILLSPFFALLAIGIKRTSPGPVFYRGVRVGRNRKPFQILKFRTMYECPESYAGPRVTAHDDPRVTPLGRWLRDTKMNELPQFWNVLKGEMSLVGPRPEDPQLVATWPEPAATDILSMRPGITSPASVQYHNEELLLGGQNVMDRYFKELSPDKLRLDQLYVRHHSLGMDLDVLLWTGLIILPRVSAHTPPEELLLAGPITHLLQRNVQWFFIDLVITLGAILMSAWIIPFHGVPQTAAGVKMLVALGIALLFSLVSTILGVNRIAWAKATVSNIFDLLPAWGIVLGASLLVNWRANIFPPALLGVASILALIGYLAARFRTRLLMGALSFFLHLRKTKIKPRERILVVGSGRTAEHVAWIFNHPTYAEKFHITGFVDDVPLSVGMRIYGGRVIGVYKDIPALVNKHDIGVIILADHRIFDDHKVELLKTCVSTPAKVVVIPDIFGSFNGLLHVITEDTCRTPAGNPAAESPCAYCLGKPSLWEMTYSAHSESGDH